MEKIDFINLKQACEMSERELQFEIGKLAEYLREELGMDRIEAANLISSILNMGVALNERLKERKLKKKQIEAD